MKRRGGLDACAASHLHAQLLRRAEVLCFEIAMSVTCEGWTEGSETGGGSASGSIVLALQRNLAEEKSRGTSEAMRWVTYLRRKTPRGVRSLRAWVATPPQIPYS